MDSQTFDAAVEAARQALGSMAKGDPEPSLALWSRQLVSMDLRVTTIFRREADGWRLCVRHADRVQTPPF